MAKVVSATKVRENFADILNRVTYAGEEFVVERQGKPTALITRVGDSKIVALKKPKKKKMTMNDFFFRLSRYKLKGGPKDLAANHDEYLWENYRS